MCRSDMQRERSRERMERARRQWELENADSLDPAQSAATTPHSSLPRHQPQHTQNKVPSYEATVLHMVSSRGASQGCFHNIILSELVFFWIFFSSVR